MAAGRNPGESSAKSNHAGKKRKLLPLLLVVLLVLGGLGGIGSYMLFLSPPAISAVNLSTTADTTVDQGTKVLVSVAVLDAGKVDQARNTTFEWSADPSDAAQISTTPLKTNVFVLPIKAGSVTVTALARWNRASKPGSIALDVRALSFEVRSSKVDPVVGQPVIFTITATRSEAKTDADRIAKTYQGNLEFTSDVPGGVLFPSGPKKFQPASQGVQTFSGIAVMKRGTIHVTVKDTVAAISGSVALWGDAAPVALFRIIPNKDDRRQVTVDASASFDPDDGDLIKLYSWAFGDDTTLASSSPVAQHTYTVVANYTIGLTVRDSHQGTNSLSQVHFARAPPVASFVVASREAAAPDVVFRTDASASGDPNGVLISYEWNWGDGSSTGPSASPLAEHTYTAAAIDALPNRQAVIGLKVVDDKEVSAIFSRRVVVTTEDLAPFAAFTLTVDQLNRTVTVDASASWDPKGIDVAFYNWTWGDGQWDNLTTAMATHPYATDSPQQGYDIVLTVGDPAFRRVSTHQSQYIHQPDVPPIATFTVNRQKLHVYVDASASFDYNGDLANYTWDWGDGATTGPVLDPKASHDYTAVGLHTIKLTVLDRKGNASTKTAMVTVAPSTIDHQFYDFFNVPYKEYWDIRSTVYHADYPIGAECFSATSIADNACTPEDPNVPDVPSYPYTDWYALPGPTNYSDAKNNAFIYAPYRWSATGLNVPSYNLSEPVFLPVLNYGEHPGSFLYFDWKLSYLQLADSQALTDNGLSTAYLDSCPGVGTSANDGYLARYQINLTMDLQESKRIFGIDSNVTTQHDAWWWWYNKTVPIYPGSSRRIPEVFRQCYRDGALENSLLDWYIAMGGDKTVPGKYDIENGYEWWYAPFYLNLAATIEPDGTTHVTIDTTSWGGEVLFGRWMYWGNTSYIDNWMDSTKARGWSATEVAWFEDLTFRGSLGTYGMDFAFDTVMQYDFQLICDAGPNGVYDHVDDGVAWTWGPWLNDYLNDFSQTHLVSEMDRYNGPDGIANNADDLTYPHCTPGVNTYGKDLLYDYTPITWNPKAGETWHFQFPKGNVVFYDPNLTPVPTNPLGQLNFNGFVAYYKPLSLQSTPPDGFGVWDGQAMTWDVYGPRDSGGGDGSPGHYVTEPWPSINLGPAEGS